VERQLSPERNPGQPTDRSASRMGPGALPADWRAIAFAVPNDGSSERNPRVFVTFLPDPPPAAAVKAEASLEAIER
jgi:hypothetical protein